MISLPIGAILTVVVFILSMGFGNLPLYFNWHSLLLVGGGTVAIFAFSTPVSVLSGLFKEVRELFGKGTSFTDVRSNLIDLAKSRDRSLSFNDELTLYAQDLWTQGISQDLFVVLISQKRKEIEQRSVDAIQSLKNLAKYPPALGMAGTVMGIVTLFQSLESNKSGIGPALAMALTATFFGLAIANGVVMPISDRLQVRHLAKSRYLDQVYQVLLLINQDEAPQLIEEEVKLRGA
ncbi:MAG TPA: MotA/TolQ/ExbB proton channel family protein [Pseudobdellovibrionaceae bacterium]|nr:MotA/TolQ/ExbB proton channel family protein [Pseudobdellovibrionaceae bacterium]